MNELLHDHVESFNAGVRSGEWGPMLERFDDDAEMEFRGIPVGPYQGKKAIAEAYRTQPPDDELRLLEEREREGRLEARYAWLAETDVAAGELQLTARDGLIHRLVVTFDRGVEWGSA
jgi:steroid Delta-isomerase